jgi:hypothetical protein
MPRPHRHVADDDSVPVMVPRNDKPLVAVAPERVRRLREHLIKELRDLRKARHIEHVASPLRPEPSGFAGVVARSACSLCKGWCCKNGGDDAFLDDRTLARMRLANPDMTEGAMLRRYLDRVPAVAYRDSCIYHGKQGCMLDRSMRADVCNTYYCGGLSAFMKDDAAAAPIVVIAGEGDKVRTSPILTP